MSKYYDSKEFKKLNKEWQAKVAKSGFEDIENDKEELLQYDRRTMAFDNRDAILEFFLALDTYLNNPDHQISTKDRDVLTLLSEGVHIKGDNGIIEKTGWSDKTIRNIVKKYKKLVYNI